MNFIDILNCFQIEGMDTNPLNFQNQVETADRRWSSKQVLLNSAKFTRNHLLRSTFFDKIAGWPATLQLRLQQQLRILLKLYKKWVKPRNTLS